MKTEATELAPEQLSCGSLLGDYRLEALLARGGMGVVYSARQLSLNRRVALKLISPVLAEDASFRERFERESHIAIEFEHPHVVPVYAVGEAQGLLFIAMRYIEGSDLHRLIEAEAPLAPERVLALIEQIASGLDAAHRKGLVHRDIKPANVMVERLGPEREHCYVMDFGLAKQRESTGFTRSGKWVGTLDYVAPEQIRGDPVDARTDVYALGALLYQGLTSNPPFFGEHDAAKLFAHLTAPPPRASEARPELPRDLDGVVIRALAKDPEHRFPSAGDLARAAKHALTGTQPEVAERNVAMGAAAPQPSGVRKRPDVIEARPKPHLDPRIVEEPAKDQPLVKRRWRASVLVGAVALIIAVAIALIISSSGGSPRRSRGAAVARGSALATAASTRRAASTTTAPPKSSAVPPRLSRAAAAAGGRALATATSTQRAASTATAPAKSSAGPTIIPAAARYLVTAGGAVGPLTFKIATQPDVERVFGSPALRLEHLATATREPQNQPYRELGYDCSTIPDPEHPPQNVIKANSGNSGCKTFFYINLSTSRLEAFQTRDTKYQTTKGSVVGMSETTAEAHEGIKHEVGCITVSGLVLDSPSARLVLLSAGGHPGPEGPTHVTLAASTIERISLESAPRGAIGIQQC